MNIIKLPSGLGLISEICGICGEPHKYSECNIIKINKCITDNVIPSRARLSLPTSLDIQTMADGTYCTVANTLIEKGTQFGPLEAQKLFTLNPSIMFPLKLFNQNVEDLSEYYLDTCDENTCNWMIFVMPAQNFQEQNLVCFQEKSRIFYVTIKDIKPGEFLKVWYSPYYAKRMNKGVLTSQNPVDVYVINEEIQPIDLNKLLKKQQKLMDRDHWTCKFCGKLEKEVTLFATHILDHYKQKLKKACDVCKETFPTSRKLQRHKKLHSRADSQAKKYKLQKKSRETRKTKDTEVGGPLLNDLLNDSFDNTTLVPPSIELTNSIENQNSLLETDNLSLNVDNLITENVKELDHFNFEIGESQEQHVCDVCLKVFTKLAYLLQHLRKHTGRYTCRQCLKIFCRSENLHGHRCNNMKEPIHICNLCQKGFMLRKYLVRHMDAIHNKKYACEHCNKKYYSHKEYKEHNCIAVPDNKKQTFPCVTCNKRFYREIYLRKHLRTHLHRDRQAVPPKHFICEVCAQRFKSRKGLRLHMKIHLERTLVCEVCNKKFYRQDVLNTHMTTHEEGKISCTVCNTKLKTKQTLAIHMLQHTGMKPHKCDMCSQQYHQRSHLVKHYTKVHQKTCYVCHKRFASDEILEKHQTEHLLKEVFVCPLCDKNIKLRSSLRRHLKQVHPETDAYGIMYNIKPKQVDLDGQINNVDRFDNIPQMSRSSIEMLSDLLICDTSANLEKTKIENDDNLDNIADSFENIIKSCDSNAIMNNCEKTSSSNKRTLDFSDLTIDNDSIFDTHENMNVSDREICLSMPDLTESDQEITLGENAYILENGTIVEPKEQGNVYVYILDKHF